MVFLLIAVALPAIAQKRIDKSAVDALYQQGIRLLQKGDLAAARAAFEKVVRLAPNAPEGHNSLGWVLMTTGNLDEAVAQLRTAVKLKPDFVEAHINLANALAANRDKEDAGETPSTQLGLSCTTSSERSSRRIRNSTKPRRNFPQRFACNQISRLQNFI